MLKHWAKTACGESKCWEFKWKSFLQTQSCSCIDQHFENDFRKWIYLTWEWNSIQLQLFYIQKLILSQYFCKNLLVAINPFYFDKDFSFFPNCFTLLICQLSCVILKDSFFSFFSCFVQIKGKWKTYDWAEYVYATMSMIQTVFSVVVELEF